MKLHLGIIFFVFFIIPCYSLTTVTVSPETFDAEIDENVTIEVSVENDQELREFIFRVSFDPEFLAPVSELTQSGFEIIPKPEDRIVSLQKFTEYKNSLRFRFLADLSALSSVAVGSGSGKLFSFKLKALKYGTTNLTYSRPRVTLVKLVDGNSVEDEVIYDKGGKVNIKPNNPGINNVEVNEGDTGEVSLGFTVYLGEPGDNVVTVFANTVDETARQEDNDYEPLVDYQLVFNPGETLKNFNVKINGDTKLESDETFEVKLSSSDVTFVNDTGTGTGTIKNDDSTLISIDDVRKIEGDIAETTSFDFTVSLSHASEIPITVQYSTADGSSTGLPEPATLSDNDYQRKSNETLTFNPGDLSKILSILVNTDTKVEGDERFFVDLSNPRLEGVSKPSVLSIFDAQGVGIIRDDDKLKPVITSITRAGIESQGSNYFVKFLVKFNKDVENVSSDDFELTKNPAALTPSISQTNNSAPAVHDSYLISVNTGPGEGTIGITIKSSNDIQDVNNRLLTVPGSFVNESFVIWEKSLSVTKGWNLFSLPGPVFNKEFSNLFPDALPSIWTWNSSTFIKVTNAVDLEKKGFWIYFPNKATISIRGVNANSSSTSLVKGWNLVGVTSELSDFSGLPVRMPMWFWQGNHYASIQRLSPFIGYWIYSRDSRELK